MDSAKESLGFGARSLFPEPPNSKEMSWIQLLMREAALTAHEHDCRLQTA